MADSRHLEVIETVTGAMRDTSLSGLISDIEPVLAGGKLLRGNLVLSLAPAGGLSASDAVACAAAVEMLHAASLVHDDVIDGGQLRRGVPSFWKEKGMSGAILLGDLLVCKAVAILCNRDSSDVLVPSLVKYAGELCDAEAEQELILRGVPSVWDKYVNVARRKTGSLFAFAASVCGKGEDGRKALEEAGYKLGTAYQLADDFYDAYGDPAIADKSLGRDAARMKGTAPTFEGVDGCDPVGYIDGLMKSASENLASWPEIQAAWTSYISEHFDPAMERFLASARSEIAAERCVGS